MKYLGMMNINYQLRGTPNSPVLIFSNSLGSTYHMWDGLVPYLLPYFRVLQMDTRGHGGTGRPVGPYSIEMMGKDVLRLMDELQIEKAYFCGLSMGGLIGQWLGIHAANRFHKIVLSNTAAKIGTMEAWQQRVDLLSKEGMSALVEGTMEKWFTDAFRQTSSEQLALSRDMFLSSDVPGYSNCCLAIGEADFSEQLSSFSVPALVITGDEDAVTHVAHAEKLVELIPDAVLNILHGRHLVSTEFPQTYAEALIDFFVGTSMVDRGMHVRKTVLGEAHVARSKENINGFNDAFQELVAQVPWGQVWTRPGLNKHERSLITLSMMIALNRGHEFKMHVKAAFHNGVSVAEIKEVILQAAIYCGFPAALDAYKNAEEVFQQEGIEY
jgi:3-oxoadipate enol-lactonase/4-carboxymuconolactone decarboxylase